MMRLLLFALVPLKVWMVIDALRRRADTYWLWIIMGVPGGEVAYFFLVRMRDHDARRLKHRFVQALKGPERLERLEFRFRESPSIVTRLALAQGLGRAERWAEAREHFEAVLAQRPEEHDALFGLGVCELELQHPQAAVVALEALAALNAPYHDFAIFPELAAAHEQAGDPERGLDLLRELARREPRLRHVVHLAEALVRRGELEEARDQLRQALLRDDDAPAYVRRTNRPWRRRARALLRRASLASVS